MAESACELNATAQIGEEDCLQKSTPSLFTNSLEKEGGERKRLGSNTSIDSKHWRPKPKEEEEPKAEDEEELVSTGIGDSETPAQPKEFAISCAWLGSPRAVDSESQE